MTTKEKLVKVLWLLIVFMLSQRGLVSYGLFIHVFYFWHVRFGETDLFLKTRDFELLSNFVALELKTRPCDSNPCQNGGICSNNGETFKCKCIGIYRGIACKG